MALRIVEPWNRLDQVKMQVFFCDWSQLISKTIKYSHQIQLVIFSQSENSLPDLRAAAIIGFGKQHELDLCEQKRYFMLVNDGLRLIK